MKIFNYQLKLQGYVIFFKDIFGGILTKYIWRYVEGHWTFKKAYKISKPHKVFISKYIQNIHTYTNIHTNNMKIKNKSPKMPDNYHT